MGKVDAKAVAEKVQGGAALSVEEKDAVLKGDVDIPDPEVKEPDLDPKGKEVKTEEPKDKKTEGTEKIDSTKDADKGDSKPKEDGEKDGAKAEDKKSEEEGAKTSEAPKKTEEQDKAEWEAKAEKELSKPEGFEDLSGFTPREKGLFYELRRQRRRAQQAEREQKEAEFQLMQERTKKKTEVAAAGEPKEDPEKELNSIFEGKEDDDLLTVAETKKILAAARKTPARADNPEVRKELAGLKFQMAMIQTASKHPDAPDVISHLDELLDNEEPYSVMAKEEVQAAYLRGGNFIQVAYNFIKGHPKWPEIEKKIQTQTAGKADAEVKDPDLEDKKKRAEKIKTNEDRVRTTGGAGGGDSGRADEYTLEELSNMSQDDWNKIPKSKRQELLRKLS